MRTHCCLCGAEIELSVDEFLDIDQELDDYFCDDCATAAVIFCSDLQLRLN